MTKLRKARVEQMPKHHSTKTQSLCQSNPVPGLLADECWTAFQNREINRDVLWMLAEMPDMDAQRRTLEMASDAACERFKRLHLKVRLKIWLDRDEAIENNREFDPHSFNGC
ncbi:hypothetical protein BH10PLA2_BH10PLA2_25440 [soil metagenome]